MKDKTEVKAQKIIKIFVDGIPRFEDVEEHRFFVSADEILDKLKDLRGGEDV